VVRAQAISLSLAVAPFGVTFGIAASDAGLAVWQASAFSALVFTGSAQFAAVEIIGDGGSAVSAIVAGLLLNVRSLAFGVVMAPSLPSSRWRRALWSQLMIDETTAVGSAQTDHAARRYGYIVTGVAVFVTWNVSTVLGAGVLGTAGDVVTRFGFDATIPAAFLALLWPRLAARDQGRAALVGAVVALALVPVTPPGVPIIAATVGVAVGWRARPGSRAS